MYYKMFMNIFLGLIVLGIIIYIIQKFTQSNTNINSIKQIVQCPIGYKIENNVCVFDSCPSNYYRYDPPQGGQTQCLTTNSNIF